MAEQQKKKPAFVVIRNKHTAPIDGVAPGTEGRIEGIGPSHHAVEYYVAAGMAEVVGGAEAEVEAEPAAALPASEKVGADGEVVRDAAKGAKK